jgi:hypothetical protein
LWMSWTFGQMAVLILRCSPGGISIAEEVGSSRRRQ